MAWAKLTTKIYQTKSGMSVREDAELCGKPKADGIKCDLTATRIYFKYNDPSKVERKNYAFICKHQETDIGADKMWWSADMVIDLFNLINQGKKFKEIQDELKKLYPSRPWWEVIKPETRPGKGKYKEYDCSAKKKYEDIKQNSCGEVWDEKVLRKDAKSTCVTEKDFAGFRKKLIDPKIDDSICKLCGHEIFWHSKGMCGECKAFCDGND